MLVLTQGILFGIGGSLLYGPCLSYLSEWFISRRGMANGILFAGRNILAFRCPHPSDFSFIIGTSIGGLFLPLALPPLFRAFGVAKATRILSGIVVVSVLPGLPFIRGRLPELRVHGPRRVHDQAWLKDGTFWVTMIVNTLQGFAFFIPIIWLPCKLTVFSCKPSHF
jgi:MFS transporter, MCT family, solute carrier family 16 (monocarboxylic acid transporters), member 10